MPNVVGTGGIGREIDSRGHGFQFYADPQSPDARQSLARWGIDLVVAGNLERQKYGVEVDQRLDAALPAVFRAASTTIYRFSVSSG